MSNKLIGFTKTKPFNRLCVLCVFYSDYNCLFTRVFITSSQVFILLKLTKLRKVMSASFRKKKAHIDEIHPHSEQQLTL